MHVWKRLPDWAARRQTLEGQTIGFVPTMGALHHGHISLVNRCRAENDVVAVSIFINPSQFNDAKDLERYPQTLDQDLALLEKCGADDVLAPMASDLYPRGYRLRVDPLEPAPVMEALHRPGFLQGVLTIVLKLLNVVYPHRAYFGEKDYQQLQAVTEMVQDFFLPTAIIACPTVRDSSGLALSSRNALLSEEGGRKAASIFRILSNARSPEQAREALEAEGFLVDYVEEHWRRWFAAAWLEGVRLIDNVQK